MHLTHVSDHGRVVRLLAIELLYARLLQLLLLTLALLKTIIIIYLCCSVWLILIIDRVIITLVESVQLRVLGLLDQKLVIVAVF